MRTNQELRKEARDILRNGWFWRLLTVGIVLNLVCYGVQGALGAAFAHYGVDPKSIPSLLLQFFFSYIFGAIAAFGLAGAFLKAVANNDERWFSGSFGGFARPFEVAWLLFIMNVRVLLWSLLLIFPGLIAAYRYRQAWYLKNEHPEWTAGKCLSESGRIMKGYKWRAFSFDCSYFWWFLLVTLFLGVAATSCLPNCGNSMVASLSGLLGCWLLCWVAVYFVLGRTVFYRELLKTREDTH